MSPTDFLYMLLGALLVAIGVVAGAFADRIRRAIVHRDIKPENTIPTARARRATPAPAPAEVARPAPEVIRLVSNPVEPRVSLDAIMAKDVTAALTSAGYPKKRASDAVAACAPGERVSLEAWTAAALRRARTGATA